MNYQPALFISKIPPNYYFNRAMRGYFDKLKDIHIAFWQTLHAKL